MSRQKLGIELIASENFASRAVTQTMASVLTNKYAEGLPGKRYYGGCEFVDEVEKIAIERLCNLFGCRHANVQPHSGAQANAAVFLALLKPGDTILGMDLSHGGHLTHGSPVNFSGMQYQAHFYGVDPEDERIHLRHVREQALSLRPKMIIAGASAYSRVIDFKGFREIADEVGAYLMVDMAHIAGLVAGGVHPSPFEFADVVTTTTHKTLRGPRGGVIMWNRDDLNFNKAVFPGTQGGPLMHVIAAKAVCFKEAMEESFRGYQKQVIRNSQFLAKALVEKGFRIVSGGTDNHLMLIDLGVKTDGKTFERILGEADITVNKNTVPREKRSPFVTSGIRMGTPAVTTRGMRESEMEKIAAWTAELLSGVNPQKVKGEVHELTKQFPLYPGW